MQLNKKDANEKKRRERKKDGINAFHSFIIMAYWINIGSRGRQALLTA